MTASNSESIERFSYDDAIVRKFVIATLGWAFVAFLVGVWLAFELVDHKLNLGLSWLTFGRLRPLHTNAAIFAFGGNAVFAGVYYSTQRLTKARMASDTLSKIHFWGWQAIIVAAALTLPLGITQSKEYAELEWPIDIAIAVIWVVFAINFFATLFRRRERHLYVALWFYMATIITVALLHIINSIEVPVSWFQSYPVYAGVQDALVQWWYGHNAVAFFLTTPFLGLMYYFMPKAVNGPIYSYRLSIIHFWSLVFIYIWAGPHHLLYTSLPEWAQTLGMVFSVMLLAPSWGGMINGLLTLRSSWGRLRTEPILKFLALAVTLYGMSTFEGPLLSIKSVNNLAHYTDWIIGHVHGGTLGWNGFLTFGMLYWMIPRLWKTELYSQRLANTHFWLGAAGILLYVTSMWVSGITQGLMWRAMDPSGRLVYPDFVETVVRIKPLFLIRALGGVLYLVGFVLMIYNVAKTLARAPKELPDPIVEAPALARLGNSVILNQKPHRVIESLPTLMAILTVISVMVGTVIEILPALTAQEYVQYANRPKPYSPLELEGRDIYVREGCYVCHSQQIRPFLAETLRYGKPSELADSMYDHPFQWGSKRTGPDLARVGGRYPDLWHFRHMRNPRDVVQQSIMPSYPWLYKNRLTFRNTERKLEVLHSFGVPYSQNLIVDASAHALAQAEQIAKGLVEPGSQPISPDTEIVALIAYLQKLGK